MHDENNEGEGGCMKGGCMACHMAGHMNKDIKLAMLDKKEKMLKAKLEFIGKVRGAVEEMSDEKGE